ncbi:unnamed protein product [Schistocephalus solidus]|uniref:Uncharacterized protein n=1 Tax=Schistocephalus solidus TaxID=70667 RepID=A0A183T442_SCHSO|nr:unnamed protein product [Schistocephalus solidus]
MEVYSRQSGVSLFRSSLPDFDLLLDHVAISDAAIDRIPQVVTNSDLDLPPSLPETIQAAQQICSGEAPGSDAIPPEVFKHGGPRMMDELKTLPGDVVPRTSSSAFQRRNHRPSLQVEGKPETL